MEYEKDLKGPLPTRESLVNAGSLGLAVDAEGNLWWGDGNSLRMARRLPEDRPEHILEVLRVASTRGVGSRGTLILTAAVLDKDGRALSTLRQPEFRMIRGDQRLLPINIQNLSEELPGRRILVVLEASDALFAHRESLGEVLEFWLQSLTGDDRTAVMDVRDTFTMLRDFTGSVDIVRRTLLGDRARVATIDLRQAAAVRQAILTLAPTDYARAVLWVTSGEGVDEAQAGELRRMAIANQVPLFILHVGDTNRDLLERLAARTNARYFRLYAMPTAAELPRALAEIRSGRYRVGADIAMPNPQDRGRWFDVTLEAAYLDGVAYDRSGYYSF